MRPNNAVDVDTKKRRAFVAPLFTAGYGERRPSSPLFRLLKLPVCRAFPSPPTGTEFALQENRP